MTKKVKENKSYLDRILIILGKIFISPFQYFLSLLGIFLIAGKIILTFIGGIVALIVLLVALFIHQVFDVNITADIPNNTVVEINLAGMASEVPEENPLLKLMGKSGQTLPDTMEALRLIQEDKAIQGVILRLDHSLLAPAQVEELRGMIQKIRKTGKKVLAYADSFEGEGHNAALFQYYLACACDEIWMQPLGTLAIQGLILEVPFAKKGLDKMGVKSLLRKRHEYKNAPDTLNEEKFTGPARESMQALVDSFIREIAKAIENERDIAETQVKKLINEAPWLDDEAKRYGLIDRVAYNDELIAFFSEDKAADKPQLLSMSDYIKRRKYSGSTKELKKEIENATRFINKNNKDATPAVIALIYAEGDIIQDIKGDTSFKNQTKIGGHALSAAIREAVANPDVQALILRLNTGGGAPTGSELIRRELSLARKKGKKIVVSMAGAAASGGYWIATAADKIVAQPSTITGSIGVYSGKLLTTGLWENLGIFWDEVHSGDNAVYSSQTQDYTELGIKRLDAQLDRIYEEFIKHVVEARKLNEEHVREIAKGRVWSGADAHKFGLVDKLGGLDTALEVALQELKRGIATPVELIQYPKPRSFMEKIQSFWSMDIGGTMIKLTSFLKSLDTVFQLSQNLSGYSQSHLIR